MNTNENLNFNKKLSYIIYIWYLIVYTSFAMKWWWTAQNILSYLLSEQIQYDQIDVKQNIEAEATGLSKSQLLSLDMFVSW